MSSKEQSVTLLRKNKRAQVEALNSLGFRLGEEARAADFPMFLKWGAGLLDVTVAANRKSDNHRFFFSLTEWQSLSVTEQGLFLLRGVRVRACGTSFIIAPDTITNKAWGTNKAIPDAQSWSGRSDLYRYFDAYTETRLIIDALGGTNEGAPAAECAMAYKAFSESRDGLEDDSQWCLPTQAHLSIMWRFMAEINAVITAVWSADFNISMQKHWSCCSYDNNNKYCLMFANGGRHSYDGPTTTGAVRPICLD